MDTREYQRRLALHCLAAAGECTGDELLEQMGLASMGVGHPPELLPATVPAVVGLLRELQGTGLVARCPDRHDGRHGRGVAVWQARGAVLDLPELPRNGAAAPPAPGAFRQLTVDQRLGFLEAEFEDWMRARDAAHRAAQERDRAEFDAFMGRVRRLCAAEVSA